jgi:hypothetical protein
MESTLSSRIYEAVQAAQNAGHDIASIAKACNISVQAVYQWLDPLNQMKTIRSNSLLGLSDISGFSPWYISLGVGEKILVYAKNEPQKEALKVMQPLPIEDQIKISKICDTLADHSK